MQRDEFLALLSSEGFNEVVTVTRDPNGLLDVHVHPFEAKALIVQANSPFAAAASRDSTESVTFSISPRMSSMTNNTD